VSEPTHRSMLQPWKKTGSRPVGDFRIFQIRSDRVISPRTGVEHEFFVVESVNWVNVIAITPDQQLVMIEQYRHGTGTVELEVPGGMMDARDAGPEAAAVRELREETGYEGEKPRIIGQVFPNPANRVVPIIKEFRDAFEKYGKVQGVPSHFNLEGYLAGKILVEAIRRSKDSSPAGVVRGLEMLHDWDMGGYVVDFSPTKHNGSKFVDMSIISAGGELIY